MVKSINSLTENLRHTVPTRRSFSTDSSSLFIGHIACARTKCVASVIPCCHVTVSPANIHRSSSFYVYLNVEQIQHRAPLQ